jgi:anti-sigma factor RsiW
MSGCMGHAGLLHGLIDGELDAANCVMIEAHIRSCASCTAELCRLEDIRTRLAAADMRYSAPRGLLDRIQAQIDTATAAAPRARVVSGHIRLPWFAGGALTAIAASLALFLAVPQVSTRSFQSQLVASHMRSLLAAHLTDVATSNQHVVKPWFNGRIDFAIPVVDLAIQGYPLVGGRLDYLDDHVVPALIYKRRLHTINLFIRPASTGLLPTGFATTRRGFSIVRWTGDGLEYWAVSDMDIAELRSFAKAFETSAAQGRPR